MTISTMENAGHLIEYPDMIENADMDKYYERKYECPWRSADTCKSCDNASCPRKITNESEG